MVSRTVLIAFLTSGKIYHFRPKTSEEIAEEKAATIRKQEADRLARMKFNQEDKKIQHQSADALCD